MSWIEQYVSFVCGNIARRQRRRHQRRRHQQRRRPSRGNPGIAKAAAFEQIVCGDGRRIDRDVIRQFYRKRPKGRGNAIEIEMHKLLQQRQRNLRCCVHHRHAGTVPTASVQARPFTIKFMKTAEGETPDAHLFDNTVGNAAEYRFDEPSACLGIQQVQRPLPAQDRIPVP